MNLFRRVVAGALAFALLGTESASAQITVPNTFVTRQVISSVKFNQNFDEIELKALNRTAPVLQATLTVDVNNTYDLGATALRFRDGWFGRNVAIGGTLGVTGVATFTVQPVLSSLTASQAVFTDGSKGLVSNAITGSGSVVMSVSPTLTGTVNVAALTASGTITAATFSGSGLSLTGVDLLASVNTHTLAGLHTWTGSTNGPQRLVAVNTTSGTGAFTGFRADAGTTVMVLDAFSQGYTTSGSAIAASVKLEGTGIGGVSLVASGASGDARIYSRNALAVTWGASQAAAFTGAVDVAGAFSVATNKFTVASASGNTLIAGTLALTGDFAINTNKFNVTASSGNTSVAGTLTVTGLEQNGGLSGNGSTKHWSLNSNGDWLFGSAARIADSSGTPALTSGFGIGGAVNGQDYAFAVDHAGSANTGGVITFGHTFINAPVCTVSDSLAVSSLTIATTTTTATIAYGSTASGGKLLVLCRGF